jgi:hypothetical protein
MIVAKAKYRLVDAAHHWIATIVCARVVVVARNLCANTLPCDAGLARSAGVLVIASTCNWFVVTPEYITIIPCAKVSVLAINGCAFACALNTTVIHGARVLVVTCDTVAWRKDAADIRVAHVLCARIVVVACHRITSAHMRGIAIVVHCARVAIIAGSVMIGMIATMVRQARIVGAGVMVIAVTRHALACARATGVVDCAFVTIVARFLIVGEHAPQGMVAISGDARVVRGARNF